MPQPLMCPRVLMMCCVFFIGVMFRALLFFSERYRKINFSVKNYRFLFKVPVATTSRRTYFSLASRENCAHVLFTWMGDLLMPLKWYNWDTQEKSKASCWLHYADGAAVLNEPTHAVTHDFVK